MANATAQKQYQAALWELKNNKDFEPLLKAFQRNPNMTPQEAATLWNHMFERPGNYASEDPARQAMAANIYSGALDPRNQPKPDASGPRTRDPKVFVRADAQPKKPSDINLSNAPKSNAMKAAQSAAATGGGSIYNQIVAAGGDYRKVSHNIENHVTVNAPSGNAHEIAKTVVGKLAQHQGIVAQVGGSLS
jgi:hypothetical protein